MRRTAPALSVAALAGAVVGFAASAAYADPAAEVSPGTVSPGGSVTVEVSCDSVDGDAPATVDATSQAFEEGTVALKRVTGDGGKAAGPAYRGTATVPAAEKIEGDSDAGAGDSAWTVDGTCPAAPGKEGKPWRAKLTVARESGGTHGSGAGTQALESTAGVDGAGADSGGAAEHDGTDAGTKGTGDAGSAEDTGSTGDTGGADDTSGAGDTGGADSWGGTEGDSGGTDSGIEGTDSGVAGTGTGDRHCTEPPAGKAEPGGGASHWSEAEPGAGSGEAHPGDGGAHARDCADADVDHGVRAGSGGTFTDSVPALVAGGLLIAGALGGAVYRLRRKTPTGTG
ncbi:hypothetical protein ACHBTE_01225 [Streptomyces sp. M41]|uniref:hypothetical protein n=1 Tax=Streptomyces sp. M41 TaxID=3059412 RepID=UPI00374D6EB5